jgi:iron complex outermembrane receptor protein
MTSRSEGKLRALLLLSLSIGSAPVISAQAASSSPAADATDEVVQLERFVTSGSAIPTAASETFSPVTVYTINDLFRQGASMPIEAVRHLPGFSGAVSTEQRTNGGNGNASVNLRGLAGTLSLLNGHRTAGFDNFNAIPSIAIARIDVVKDGASALYGADALSGVFNVVLIPHFDGVKVDTFYGNTTDKDAGVIRAGILAGGKRGKTDVVLGVEYYHRNALYSSDRDVSADADGRSRGGKNQGSVAFPGQATARVGSSTAPVQDLVLAPGKTAGFTAADFIPLDPLPTTSNQLLNFRQYTPTIPEQFHTSVYARVNQALVKDRIEAHATLLYTHDVFYDALAPASMVSPAATGTAAARRILLAERASPHIPTGFFISDDTRSPGNILNGTEMLRTIALGPRTQTWRRDVWDFDAGLEGHFWEDWNWSADYIYSDNYRDQLQAGAPYVPQLISHILDGSYNPWALDSASGVNPNNGVAFNNPAALADSKAQANTAQHYPTRGGLFNVNGSLWSLPAGRLKLGVGGDYYRNKVSEMPDPILFSGDLLGLNASNTTISSSDGYGMYVELKVPLASPAMKLPFMHDVSLSLQGRYDDQQVEGYANGSSGPLLKRTFSTRNPKLGLRWMTNEDVMLRATWGTGFRLPTLSALFQAPGTSTPQLTDPLGFPILTQTQISTRGNPALDPEKSKTYSAGIVYSPKAVSGLSVNLDYYYGEISGLVGEGAQYILNTNAAGQGPGFVRGDATTINPAAPFAALISRGTNGGVSTINSTNFNISSRQTSGLDYGVTYIWPGRTYGRFTTRADWNTVLTWDLTPVAGAAKQSFVGVYIDTSNNGISPGSVPKQKGYLTQSWDKGPWSADFTGNYVGRLRDDPNFSTVTGSVRYIEAWVTFDAQVAYHFRAADGWGKWWDNTIVRLGGINIFDESAPYAAGAFNDSYDVKTHSVRGRFLYTQVTKTF